MRQYIMNLHNTASAQQQDLKKQLTEAQYTSLIWKFAYLNQFYVPVTKQVLIWFSVNSPQSVQSFHITWQAQIPDQTQREAVLKVLTQFGMLQEKDQMVSITPEGGYFLQYLGLGTSTSSTGS